MPQLGERRSPIDRILARVDIEEELLDPDVCVLWPGAQSGGYGKLSVPGGQLWAHRVVYEHFIGPIPAGRQVDHLCHNEDLSCPGGAGCLHRLCLNWRYHFEIKTTIENRRAADEPRQRAEFATHCPNGHEWNEENTGWLVRGARGGDARGDKVGKPEKYCKTCNRERAAARKRMT